MKGKLKIFKILCYGVIGLFSLRYNRGNNRYAEQ